MRLTDLLDWFRRSRRVLLEFWKVGRCLAPGLRVMARMSGDAPVGYEKGANGATTKRTTNQISRVTPLTYTTVSSMLAGTG
jgi:hypothetical protein